MEDVMQGLAKNGKTKGQTVPKEVGNNGAVDAEKGTADFGDGSYASSLEKSK